MTLAAAITAVFGASTVANAEEQGKKKEKGLLEKWYDNFKSWFAFLYSFNHCLH